MKEVKELARTGNKKNNKKNSSSSSKTNNKNNKTTKKTNTNKKPVRKNYKNEKEYKKALDAWNKKNNWATTSKSTLKKTKYTSKHSKSKGNYIPIIKSDSDNSQPFSEFVSHTPSNPKVAIKATNDLATTKSKGEDYQELEARYIFSGKKNPAKPTTHGLKKNSTMVISGMGTSTILEILKNPKIENIDTFIIQSNNDHFLLRKELAHRNLKIVDEVIVYEKGIYYLILKVIHGKIKYSKKDLEFGPILKKDHSLDTLLYYQNIMNKKLDILKKMPGKYLGKKLKLLKEITWLKHTLKKNHFKERK